MFRLLQTMTSMSELIRARAGQALIVVGLFAGAGCSEETLSKPFKPTQGTPSQSAPNPNGQFTATIERTACLGGCPVATTVIHSDGRIEFRGDKNVVVSGEHSWSIDEAKIASVRAAILNASFFDLESDLDDSVRDQYRVIISVNWDGEVKRVTSSWTRLQGERNPTTPRLLAQRRLDQLALALEQIAGTRVLIAP